MADAAQGRPARPEPERSEPTLPDPRLGDLTRSDWVAIVKRAARRGLRHNLPMVASALAYSSFFAIPSVLLVAVGAFTLVAGRQAIADLIDRLRTVAPADAANLLGESLQRLEARPATGLAMTGLGLALALWSTTGAMTSYMSALNLAYERDDTRGFVKKRLVALAMVASIGVGVLLVAVLLILGPHVQGWVGSALGAPGLVSWLWWVAQWPLLVAALLAAFATVLYLAPDVEHPRWQFLTPGSLVAVVAWLAVSGAFSVYTSLFASYNKTWGSLSAVIVTLTWLWLTGLALLFGGELNAEAERSRELRRGEPAGSTLQAPHRG